LYRRYRRFAPVLALSAVLALGMAACGSDDGEEAETTTTVEAVQGSDMVTIDMTDYAYTVSGPLTAGGMIRFTNSGKEYHLAAMGKLKPGKTLEELKATLDQLMAQGGPGGGGGQEQGGSTTTARRDGDIRQQAGGTSTTGRSGATTTTAAGGQQQEPDPTAEFIEEMGFPGTVMSPGQTAEITAPNLTPGTYALLCFVPTEVEGVPHFAKGMISQLEVVEGPTPPEPTADATYKLTPGQPIEGPATLTAGSHTLKIEAAPGSQQLEPGIAKLESGTTVSEFFQAVSTLFEGTTPPPQGSAEQVGGTLPWAGFDLEGVTSFYLKTDLTAGNYTIFGFDTDEVASAQAAKEVLNIRVAEAGGSTTTTR
jgi:hypothetical protein